jgi:hypothetical protein
MSLRDVFAAELSEQSALHAHVAVGDFLDCYAVRAKVPPHRAAEIITDFPGWAQLLLKLRTVLVAPFGLSTEGPEARDKVGIFPVQSETDDEVIAGFDDRHLNFRVSVRQEDGLLSLATWVHPHNLGGRVYLAVIMPFHILIARNALARVAATQ